MTEFLSAAREAVAFVGGLAGLATASFIIFDRLIAARPTLSIQRSKYGDARLRIMNSGDDVLLIEQVVTSGPLNVAVNDSAEEIAKAAAHIPPENLILEPASQALLPIVPESGGDEERPAKIIVVYDRPGRRRWLWRRSASLKVRKSEIARFERATQVSRDLSGKKK